jgi:hypothetical protein
MRIVIPPANEATKIAEYIDKSTARYSSAINRTSREIDLIREYQKRLVADVVTGKIDVRGVSVPDIDEPEPEKGVEIGVNAKNEDEPTDEIINENNEN